jgi:hypothetical protein
MNTDNHTGMESSKTLNEISAGEVSKPTPQNNDSSNKSNKKQLFLIVVATIGFLLFGVGGFYFGLRQSNNTSTPNIDTEENQTTTVKETPVTATNEEGWISYIDENRNFEIKLPINTIERSQANYNFENMEPYSAEVISSPGNFPEVSVEISDSGTKPFIPSNFGVEDETTFSIGGRFNIQATRKFGYLYDTHSRNQTYVVYYLTFERNNEVYLIKY